MMFNYNFPRYTSRDLINYRDKERLYFVAQSLSDLYFGRFLKDIKKLEKELMINFTLDYSSGLSGDKFLIKNYPLYDSKTIYQVISSFKTRIDNSKTKYDVIKQYKEGNLRFVKRYNELSDYVIVPNLYFLSLDTSGTQLTSTSTPTVDTNFFSLRDNVGTYSTSTQYLNMKNFPAYIDTTSIEQDYYKKYLRVENNITELSIENESFNGAEFYLAGANIDDTAAISFVNQTINFGDSVIIGSGTDFYNLKMIFSTHLNTWMILGT